MALHNGTRPRGLGFLHAVQDLTIEQCEKEVAVGKNLYFDYFMGRPLKCDISGDEFEERGYDRDAGRGAAERAIAAIR